MTERVVRVGLGVVGVLVAAYGVVLLLSRQESAQVLEVATWAAVGIVVHDLVLAPLAVAAGWALPRAVPSLARPPVAAAAVALATVTLAAVPVLGRFGALEDNPTLLDRPYLAGWGVLVAALAVGVLVAVLVAAARRRRAPPGPTGAASENEL
ncbi:hypothetical protein RDV89_01650 [Nocardioides zeae]|uniref:Uncharacterized protein n=1 Tax=Nocardioides imazamoxiresistens TaxID=3231893 RepID=A0ABU3PRB1_9ACTN|nr:hypothetical protein [Nocardioides zeae]MDT9591754.1 hypothetical protein [Nocardioides zeae]